MKVKFSILNFQLILLLFVGCYSPQDNETKQPQSIVAADSLFEPTGNAELDSLLQLAAIAPQDTNLALLYEQIGDMYQDNDFRKAKEYYLKLGDLSEQLDWSKGRYAFSAGFGLILAREGLVDSSIVINLKALELAKREKNERWTAHMNVNTGNAYYSKKWYETALQYYMEALSSYEKMNDTKRIGQVYYMLKLVYNNMNLFEKALMYGEKAIEILKDDPYVLSSIASSYNQKHDHEKGNKYYEEALRICELQNNTFIMEGIYCELAYSSLMDNDLDNAEMYMKKIREVSGNNFLFDISYIFINGMLNALKGNFAQAETYTLQALELANEQDNVEAKKMCYQLLCELSLAQRKFSKYLQYREELNTVEINLANETVVHSSAEMEVKYETTKKELEIERQQNIIARQNIQRWLLAGGIAVSVVILFLLWYLLRLRNRHNRTLTERNDILTEMNATKDKFFSIISHDLKNPAIMQRDALQVLIKNSNLWDIDTITDYYGELLKSAEGQVELLYNLLNRAQIQTGRMTYSPNPFPFSLLLPDIALLRKMAENKGIDFKVKIPEDAIINGDSNIIDTIIRNLLTNAIKFTASGGQVALKVEPSENGKYTVTVSDTGTGMSEEQLQNLFKSDSTFHRKGTDDEQGSGLGLIVCKELLEKHGSTLYVESKINEGSKFWFEI